MQGILKEELQRSPHRLECARRDPSPDHALQIRGDLRLAGLLRDGPRRTHILIHVPEILILCLGREARQLHIRDHLLSNRTADDARNTLGNTAHNGTPWGSRRPGAMPGNAPVLTPAPTTPKSTRDAPLSSPSLDTATAV
jgi:hypothetical protein